MANNPNALRSDHLARPPTSFARSQFPGFALPPELRPDRLNRPGIVPTRPHCCREARRQRPHTREVASYSESDVYLSPSIYLHASPHCDTFHAQVAPPQARFHINLIVII